MLVFQHQLSNGFAVLPLGLLLGLRWFLSDQLCAQVFQFLASQQPVVPVVLLLGFLLLLKLLLDLPLLQKGLPLFLESLLIKLKLLPDELSSHDIKLGVDFELLGVDEVALLQNLIDGMFPILLIQPFILGDLVVVDLVVEDVLLLVLRFVPFNKFVLVLDGARSLDVDGLVLFGGEGWEEGEGVVDVESVGTGDLVAAVEAVALAFLGADYFAAVEAVVDEFVLLGHAVALDSLHVDFFRPGLLLLHYYLIKD